MVKFPLVLIGVLASTFLLPSFVQAKSDVEKAGDIVRALIPLSALGATIVYEKGNDGTIRLVKSFAVTTAVTQGLKHTIDSTRPNGDCCDSFPSGHTSTAFMGATFIHKRYGLKYAIPGYLGASFVAFSRVDSDKHRIGDVLAGAAIGILSSWYFTEPYKGVQVTPEVGAGYVGVHVSATW